jgi:hypothetical protein
MFVNIPIRSSLQLGISSFPRHLQAGIKSQKDGDLKRNHGHENSTLSHAFGDRK